MHRTIGQRFRLGFFVVVCSCFLLLFQTDATPALHYTARSWQMREGLPHNTVATIKQTRDGYLWIGSTGGLTRFDSLRFSVFDEKSSIPLDASSIRILQETRDGTLWIGTDGEGLRSWDGSTFITPIPFPPGTGIKAIVESKDGTIWFGTTRGLVAWRKGQREWFTMQDGLAHDVVFSLCESSDGSLWIGTSDGLQRLRDGKIIETYDWTLHPKNRFTGKPKLAPNHISHSALLGRTVRTLLCDKRGRVWIGLDGGSLLCWQDGTIKRYLRESGLPDQFVLSLFEDSQGHIWVGTRSGLCQVAGEQLVPVLSGNGDSFETVYCITEDAEGGIWIGSKDGASRLRPRPFTTLTKKDGLTHNNVMSVTEDDAGRIWIGTWGGGVNILDGTNLVSFNQTNSAIFDQVLGLAQAKDGSMWVGGDYEGGVAKVLGTNIVNFRKRNGLMHPVVRTLLEDAKGNLWIGTAGALYRWRDGAPEVWTTENGLSGNIIRALAEDSSGTIWAGTDNGLSVLRGQRFETLSLSNGPAAINDIYADASGTIWIATGSGLARISNGKIETYTTTNGMVSDSVISVLEDDFQRLWFTSLNGIFRIDKDHFDEVASGKRASLESVSYSNEDGLSTVHCNGVARPSAWKGSDGRLWFATTRGLAVIDSKTIVESTKTPPIIAISSLSADRKSMELSSAITIPPGRGELQIGFAAISFSAPERNRFKYKLEPLDDDWTDSGTRPEAHYTRLAPGTYTFRVIGCNSQGSWNQKGASILLRLRPHFWQTWWFKASLCSVVGLVLFGSYQIRAARRQEIERLRLRIAADLHDEVGSSLGSISMLSEMLHRYGDGSDETRKGLWKIHRTSMQIAHSIRDIVWFINPEYDTAQDLVQRVKDVADNILGPIEKDIQVNIQNPSTQLSLDFRQNLFLIYKETLANIAKHAKATHVTVAIRETDNVWDLIIQDNGCGFDATSPQRGNGLKNLKRRSELLQGVLDIKSNERGTTVSLQVRNH